MKSIILRTASSFLLILMLIFSVFILLRGHNEPGGGFAGGLIAAGAFSMYLIARGPEALKKIWRVDFQFVMATGLLCMLVSGMVALLIEMPFLTGVWLENSFIPVGTPVLFDLGVYLVVVGSILKMALSLEEKE